MTKETLGRSQRPLCSHMGSAHVMCSDPLKKNVRQKVQTPMAVLEDMASACDFLTIMTELPLGSCVCSHIQAAVYLLSVCTQLHLVQ